MKTNTKNKLMGLTILGFAFIVGSVQAFGIERKDGLRWPSVNEAATAAAHEFGERKELAYRDARCSFTAERRERALRQEQWPAPGWPPQRRELGKREGPNIASSVSAYRRELARDAGRST